VFLASRQTVTGKPRCVSIIGLSVQNTSRSRAERSLRITLVNSESGFEIKPVYRSGDVPADTPIGEPGEFPYTRGVYPTMYTKRPWTMRQYAGFGTAAESNARYHQLLRAGTMGLSVAFDLPTQLGCDSDGA